MKFFFFQTSEGDRGILIETENRLVNQRNVCPASLSTRITSPGQYVSFNFTGCHLVSPTFSPA
jgi:hypothetical protein